MNLEWALRRQWAAYSPLVRLVPVEKVFAGRAFEEVTRPYVVLERIEQRRLGESSSGTRRDALTLRLHFWTDDLETGLELSRLAKSRLHRQGLKWDSGAALNLQHQGQHAQIVDGRIWHRTDDYYVLLVEPKGI